MSEQANLSTEVRTFNSLEEVVRYVDGQVSRWKTLHDKYNAKLGVILRSKGQGKPVPLPKQPDKDKAKDSKTLRSSSWFIHEGIRIYRGDSVQGEAEIILAASQDIKVKLDKLEKSKKGLSQMGAKGVGNGTTLLACVRDGVPDRIALMPANSTAQRTRFSYSSDFFVRTDHV
ncbi:MAG: hypothetical protein ACE5KO_04355 [Candidatus Bathyarchaeia archaeon]